MGNTSKRYKYSGVSMIEAVVYLGIFGMIFTVMLQYFFMVSGSNQNIEDAIKLENNGIFITEHFEESFRGADLISTANTVYDLDSGVLVLDADSSNPGNVTVKYELVDSRLMFTSNTGIQSFLTRESIIIDKLRFQEIQNAINETVGVRVIFTVSLEDSEMIREFETSYILNKQL